MPPKNFKLDWKGADVLEATIRASVLGIEEVLVDCVADAQDNVPFATGTLFRSIKTGENGVEIKGDTIVGEWGSFDVNYAIGVETGNRSLIVSVDSDPDGGGARGKRGSTGGGPRRGTVRNAGNKGFLRGAADRHYGELPQRIRENL